MRLSSLLSSSSSDSSVPVAGYMRGPGSREMQNKLMQGMTLKSLKHHIALQPLFIIMGLGVTMVCAFIVRSATKGTDVNWTKQEEPYEYYRHRQFKMFNVRNLNHDELGKNIPNYKDAN